MYPSLELGTLLRRSYFFVIIDKAIIKRPSKLKFRVAVSTAAVVKYEYKI